LGVIKVSRILKADTEDLGGGIIFRLIAYLEKYMQSVPVMTRETIAHILTKEAAVKHGPIEDRMVTMVIDAMLAENTLKKVEAYEYDHQYRQAKKKK
jgi:hypothetical protein